MRITKGHYAINFSYIDFEFCHISLFIYKRPFIIFPTQHRIKQTYVFVHMFINPYVLQTGILVPFELINRIISVPLKWDELNN